MEFEDDKNLIEKAKADKKAFALIYKKYASKVFNYFWYRLNHNTSAAEDLMQDVFLRALNSLKDFKEKNYSYLTYLLTIAHNLLVDYYKKPKELSLDQIEADKLEDIPDEVMEGVEGDEKDIEKAKNLWREIQLLPLHERDVLLLFYRKNLKIAEIAKIKGKSENAIKLCLSKVRKKLKKQYDLENLQGFANKKPRLSKRKFLF